jgi:hypothetical protein
MLELFGDFGIYDDLESMTVKIKNHKKLRDTLISRLKHVQEHIQTYFSMQENLKTDDGSLMEKGVNLDLNLSERSISSISPHHFRKEQTLLSTQNSDFMRQFQKSKVQVMESDIFPKQEFDGKD